MHMVIGLLAIGLSLLLFILGFIFFKSKKNLGKKLFIACFISFGIFVIAAVTSPDFKTIQEKEKMEQASAEQKTKEYLENRELEKKQKEAEKEKEKKVEKKEINTEPFEKKIPEIVKENSEQITGIETSVYQDIVNVDISVKEDWWAAQTLSMKNSFVATTGAKIKNMMVDQGIVEDLINVNVRYYSDEAEDLLAREGLLFKDWVIKR